MQKWARVMAYGKMGEWAGKEGTDKLNWGAKTEINRRKDLIKVKEKRVGNKEFEKMLSRGTEKVEQEYMKEEMERFQVI